MMLILDELVVAERDAGDLDAALADALELKRQMWALHRRQTAQLVEQVWARAELEQQRRSLEAQTAAAIGSAEEDALTRIGNRRLLERVLGDVAEEQEHDCAAHGRHRPLQGDQRHLRPRGRAITSCVLSATSWRPTPAPARSWCATAARSSFSPCLRSSWERPEISPNASVLKVSVLPLGRPRDAPRGDDQHRRGLRAGRELAVGPGRRRPGSLPRQAAGQEPRRSRRAGGEAHGVAPSRPVPSGRRRSGQALRFGTWRFGTWRFGIWRFSTPGLSAPRT